MPIILGQGVHDCNTFIASHAPNAHAPPGPASMPVGHYIVDSGFFSGKTLAE
ncbi:hypothetical protein ACN6A1_05285 [Myxococcus virescens]|uniref:hypothetical protein n=1 Tax=Myxococcus virescens TaxID=83456 RepID=UPI003DA4DF57